MKKPGLLRKYLAEEELLVVPGAFDALSARIIEQAGFRAVFMGGFGLSASLLGKPDVGLLTMSEVVNQARNTAAAVEVPVLVDAEAGYGGISNVQRTVREFESAGVAGLFIEDQLQPVMCGTLQKYKRIIPLEDMLMKLRAALDARQDADFVIAARTDADIISLEEQIRRCSAYAQAGADLVMPMLWRREDYEAVIKEVKAPLWLLLGAWTKVTAEDLKKMGARGMVTYPAEALFVATKAVMDLMAELRTKGTFKETFARMLPPDYTGFLQFMGLEEMALYEDKLGGGQECI